MKNQYLIFLKRAEDGSYIPLTGQYDPSNSFFLLQQYHISKERVTSLDIEKSGTEQGAAPANADKKALLLKPTGVVVYDRGARNGIAYVTAYLLMNDTEMIIATFTMPTEYTTTPVDKQTGAPSDERKPYSVDLKNLSVTRSTGPDIQQHIYRGGVARVMPPDGSNKQQSFVSGTGMLAGRRGDPLAAISLHNIDFGEGKLYETSPVSFNFINIPVP